MEVEGTGRESHRRSEPARAADDVQPDGMAARLVRATVPRLHHAGTAAGADDILAPVGFQRPFGQDLRKPPGLVIIVRQVVQHLGPGLVAMFRGRDTRAAEHDVWWNSIPRSSMMSWGFQKLQLQGGRGEARRGS